MNNMDMLPDEEGTPLDWDKHEAEILDVFVTQDKPLKEVMEYMRNKYGFIATYAFAESLLSGSNSADELRQRQAIQVPLQSAQEDNGRGVYRDRSGVPTSCCPRKADKRLSSRPSIGAGARQTRH